MAFVARPVGEGDPIIGYLGEYDASSGPSPGEVMGSGSYRRRVPGHGCRSELSAGACDAGSSNEFPARQEREEFLTPLPEEARPK